MVVVVVLMRTVAILRVWMARGQDQGKKRRRHGEDNDMQSWWESGEKDVRIDERDVGRDKRELGKEDERRRGSKNDEEM